jgi:cobalt-zinc-cadmium resistance protein CzcA
MIQSGSPSSQPLYCSRKPQQGRCPIPILRLRPIMMTMLVATLCLLPAATSHGIGCDSQCPFAIVVVGGLIGALAINVFLLPTLYVSIARDTDVLPIPETEFAN